MTEYDRGAYTPHAEAPLAFDPRSPRERRPIPMTLVGSAAVLLVLVAAVVMAYRHGRGSGEAAPRTVGAPVAAVKTVAPPDARPRDPASQLDVYAPQNVAATPAFAPAPEEPAPRAAPARVQMQAAAEPSIRIETPPAPTATTTVTTRTEVAAAPTSTVVTRGAADADAASIPALKPAAKPAPVKPRTAAVASSTDATIDAALARSAAEARAAKASPLGAKPAKAVAATAPAGHGKAVVQIGAFNSAAIAQTQLAAAASAVGGGHGHAVTPVQVGARTLYRTSFTGFADRAAAQAFCARLAAGGHACIVKG